MSQIKKQIIQKLSDRPYGYKYQSLLTSDCISKYTNIPITEVYLHIQATLEASAPKRAHSPKGSMNKPKLGMQRMRSKGLGVSSMGSATSDLRSDFIKHCNIQYLTASTKLMARDVRTYDPTVCFWINILFLSQLPLFPLMYIHRCFPS